MRVRAPVTVLLAALCATAATAAALPGLPSVAAPVAAPSPAALVEAAEALPLPAPAAEAPAAVVRILEGVPVVHVVQAVLASPAEAAILEAPPEPLLAAEDYEALQARVAPGPPALPAAPPEAYVFPRDEPVPPLAAPRPEARPAAPEAPPAPAAAPLAGAMPPALAAAATAAAAVLLGLGLYVRLAPAEALASPARRRAYEAVRADPGCTVNTVARAMGVDYKTAQHHLRVLRRSGFLAAQRVGGWERYFVAGALPPGEHAAAVVLRAPAARALAQALAQRGAARAVDLARSLGVSEATASVQLRRLQAAGLARRGTDGRWAAA